MFIIAIILLVLALVAGILWKAIHSTTTEPLPGGRSYETQKVRDRGPNKIAGWIAVGLLALAALFTGLSSFYTQDVGQASIQRDWVGNIVGDPITSSGAHPKLPWADIMTYDVRNQRVVYTGGASEGDNTGGESDGPQVTIQDKDGVTTNVDLSVTYSIVPSSVRDIYAGYGDEESLRTKLIFNDIRSLSRQPFAERTTLETLTQRADISVDIRELLEKKWADDGLIVNDVAIQEVRPPEAVVKSYAAAQQAKIDVEKASANLEKARVSSQEKVVQAQAEADANSILNASLSGTILQQRYLDTLSKLGESGNLVVVPDGFNGLVNVTK